MHNLSFYISCIFSEEWTIITSNTTVNTAPFTIVFHVVPSMAKFLPQFVLLSSDLYEVITVIAVLGKFLSPYTQLLALQVDKA